LLISHDKELRRQVHTCLSSAGIAAGVLTAVRNGDECLAALAKERPRLVVLDDGGGSADGVELLRAVHRRVPEALVVYLATHHTPELERAVRQLGVLYYIEKPPESWPLAKVLAAVFARQQNRSGRAAPLRGGCEGWTMRAPLTG